MDTFNFSQMVLLGLLETGRMASDISLISGVSSLGLDLILQGKAEFDNAEFRLIECATDLTAGQLALMSEESPDAEIVELINGWAAFHPNRLEPSKIG